MNFKILKTLLSQKETKIILISTAIGGLLQIICRRYIRDHPELFEEKHDNFKEAKPQINNKTRNPRFRYFSPRGGSVIEISGLVIRYLAKNGLLWSLFAGISGAALSNISVNAISTFLRNASPQTFPELERKRFIKIEEEKIYLDQCDQDLEYLFKLLSVSDTPLTFAEKEELTDSTLTEYLNLKKVDQRVSFILCLVLILYKFSIQNMLNYHIMLKNLIKAVKKGKISKPVVRVIIRRLRKKGIPVLQELCHLVDFTDKF